MSDEFDAICAEFSSELDALSEMAVVPRRADSAALSPRARIAAGNGAVLLIAATFEEFVRQQVRAAFREKVRGAKNIGVFPPKTISSVWKRSLEALARTPFDEIETDSTRAGFILRETQLFCLKKEISADVSETLSHNESNMRPGELSRLFNQIGIQGIIAKSAQYKPLKEFLGIDSAGVATAEIESRVDEFFRKRNNIAHSIKMGTSSGPSELNQDIELFRLFAKALTAVVSSECAAPSTAPSSGEPVRRRKDRIVSAQT